MNEELKTRRDFFKKAAKTTLPILGAVLLASNPVLAKAAESEAGYCTCQGNCKGSCSGSCVSNCRVSCGNNCSGGCNYTCGGGCKGSCLNR